MTKLSSILGIGLMCSWTNIFRFASFCAISFKKIPHLNLAGGSVKIPSSYPFKENFVYSIFRCPKFTEPPFGRCQQNKIEMMVRPHRNRRLPMLSANLNLPACLFLTLSYCIRKYSVNKICLILFYERLNLEIGACKFSGDGQFTLLLSWGNNWNYFEMSRYLSMAWQ